MAGCKVSQGTVSKDALVRVTRGESVLFDGGGLSSLRHLKDEVREVQQGKECGMMLPAEAEVRFQRGDTVVAYNVRMEAQRTQWDPGF